MGRLTKFQVNQLSTFVYLNFTIVAEETLGLVIKKLLENDCYLMNKNLVDNRLYCDDFLERIFGVIEKPKYPAFSGGYGNEYKIYWEEFLRDILKDRDMCGYKIIHLTDKSETYKDEFTSYDKSNTGYKAMGLYSKENNDFVYIIRGTNGDLQWLDNCKAISEYITASENEGLSDFEVCYKKINNLTPKITVAGHSKGGLTAMVIGALFEGDIKISTMYAPFININLLKNILEIKTKDILKDKEKLDKYMDLFYPIELHIADIVGGLFLDREILQLYKEKFVLVGDFHKNGWNFFKNHEPVPQVSRHNYDKEGNPIKTSASEEFIYFIIEVNKEVLSHKDSIVYPFIISLFKEIGLLGANSPKGFYDSEIMLRESFEKQFKKSAEDMFFSFDTIKGNMVQWRETCDLLFDIFTNKEIFLHLDRLLKNEEKNVISSFVYIGKKRIIMKFIEEIIEHCHKENFTKDKMNFVELLVDIVGAVFDDKIFI